MNVPSRTRKLERGFTLIELMVSVAIIGVLVALTSTNYQKHQRKARQAEAKLGLSSIYSLEKAFYSEYNAYLPSFDGIGYTPEGSKRFYQHYACVVDIWGGTVSGYTGPNALYGYPTTPGNPFTFTYTYASVGNCTSPTWNCSTWGSDPQAYNAIMLGQLGVGLNVDVWIMSDQKKLSNCSIGY